ncbi:NAD(P)-dependent oxidoreductase [Anaerotignum lactatifermentans]|uniref:NAD(P)-dependent oxidoreductase n=1 Tax=Anaerotignum lactatifermentans TaxID=160404 RepID=UPI00267560FE|nr:NAD(P)-dependent oxidoreductase [Anaerotignum lactatifermentans]
MTEDNKNRLKVYSTLGSSNHSHKQRESLDYYATDPQAVEMLLELENFCPRIWEPACGEGHITEVLKNHGYSVFSSDLIDRGVNDKTFDFLHTDMGQWDGDIITNPPYSLAVEFIEKSLQSIPDGRKVAMFLKLQFLEGKKRKEFFKKYPPVVVYVSASRIRCYRNGMKPTKGNDSAVAYCWYIWIKGYSGEPVIRWFN